MSKETRAKRTQRMLRPTTGGKGKPLSAPVAKAAAVAEAKRAGQVEQQRQHERVKRSQAVQEHEWEAIYGTGGLTYDHWQPQRITTRGYERCDHLPNVAAQQTRECRAPVEICARCGCWRLAPLREAKAPLVSFAYEGAFCLLPSWLIGHKAPKEVREGMAA